MESDWTTDTLTARRDARSHQELMERIYAPDQLYALGEIASNILARIAERRSHDTENGPAPVTAQTRNRTQSPAA